MQQRGGPCSSKPSAKTFDDCWPRGSASRRFSQRRVACVSSTRFAFRLVSNHRGATIRLFFGIVASVGERSGPPLSESGTKKRANYRFARQMHIMHVFNSRALSAGRSHVSTNCKDD